MVIKCNFVTSFLNNVGSLWPTMLPPFAQGLMLMVLSFMCVNISSYKTDVVFKSMSHFIYQEKDLQSDSDTVISIKCFQ